MQPEFKYGFIAGGVISMSFYIDEMNYNNQQVLIFVNLIVFAALGLAIYYAMKEKREGNPKEFKFPKAMLTGAITCFYLSCIVGAYSFSYAKFINPNKAKQVTEQKVKDWKEQKIYDTAPPDSLENQIKIIETTYSPTGQLQSSVGILMVLGIFAAMLMAFFMKTKT